jgi:hypothetical protein
MFDHADNTVSFIVTDIISELEYINIKLGWGEHMNIDEFLNKYVEING